RARRRPGEREQARPVPDVLRRRVGRVGAEARRRPRGALRLPVRSAGKPAMTVPAMTGAALDAADAVGTAVTTGGSRPPAASSTSSTSSPETRILGVGTATPPRAYTQKELLDLFGFEHPVTRRVFAADHIARRHLILPEPEADNGVLPRESASALIEKFRRGA